jgi:hypothetical protein
MRKIYIAVALAAVLAGGYYATRKLYGDNAPAGQVAALMGGDESIRFSNIDYPLNDETRRSFDRGADFAKRDIERGEVKLYRFGLPNEHHERLRRVLASELSIQLDEWGLDAGDEERAFMKGYNSTVERAIEISFGSEVWDMIHQDAQKLGTSDNENLSTNDQ